MSNDGGKVARFIEGRKWTPLRPLLRGKSNPIPSRPGIYVIASGHCVSHIGEAGNLRDRISKLARLDAHRGGAKVLCAALCTGQPPKVYYKVMLGGKKRREGAENRLKNWLGEPPTPREKYQSCEDGRALRGRLTKKANQWQRGYIEATFDIGEFLKFLFREDFEPLWKVVGKPPGWEDFRTK